MREILFRGKRSDNGEWVEGQYYKREYCYGDPSVRHYIITSTETLDYDQALEYHIVDPKTIGQFTGLFDKNDKKIFEGDVLAWEMWLDSDNPAHKKLVWVEFLNGQFIIRLLEDGMRHKTMSLYVEREYLTVVGNIYDLNFTSEGSK